MKIDDVTQEQLKNCNEFNREIIEEFLETRMDLAPKTIKQYRSALQIFIVWILDKMKNKQWTDIKSLDYLRYQNWLTSMDMSESGIRFKRSAVSTVNDYITTYHSDEFPNFFNFINKAIKVPQTGKVHKKEPLTLDEYNLICNTLEEQKEWQKLCWIKFVYNSGCRKEEARQMLKEIANYDPIITIKSFKNKETGLDEEKRIVKYITHDVRCKGKGKTGNVRQLMFDEDTMKYIKLWIEERKDDDCHYLFVQKIEKTGVTRQLGEGSFNKWLNKISSMIGGKRLHPHLLRSSKATNAVIHEGKSIESVQSLLGHKSSNTTEIYVVRDKSEDADELFM